MCGPSLTETSLCGAYLYNIHSSSLQRNFFSNKLAVFHLHPSFINFILAGERFNGWHFSGYKKLLPRLLHSEILGYTGLGFSKITLNSPKLMQALRPFLFQWPDSQTMLHESGSWRSQWKRNKRKTGRELLMCLALRTMGLSYRNYFRLLCLDW